ncbi:MAG: SusC/RagA family TonB-linked outer membrane protein [Pseudobacter sp.]|uniref:SusC/RagA family TonB-linked outer membrane protein n=1 Tax=Pseudobacter sp. TaxID=2045420 RepID=UPI003F7FB5B6
MKKCLLIFLPALFFVLITRAQSITLSVKEQPIIKVFREIEKQSEFRFVYIVDVVSTARPVTINFHNTPIKEALDKIFANQPVRYEISGKTIIIKRKAEETPVANYNKKNELSGRVVNEKGEPLAGVTISVRGTDRSAASGNDGSFVLTGIDANAVINVSSIGYEARTIRLSGEKDLLVKLSVTAEQMKEVVVINTGYQQISKERATGSFEQISNKKFNQQISTDILSRLEGISSSVLVDKRSLSPSSNIIGGGNVIIRGLSTITESIKSPLIVLNNFPYEGDIGNINPNDVESITILKDAAAASIWGARAGNGVIVITTRKGNYKQPTRLSVTGNIKVTDKPDLFYLPAMSSSDFIDVEKFLFSKGFFDNDIDPANTTRPAISPVVEILARQKNGQLPEGEANARIDALRAQDVRKDFSDFIYRKTVSQQYAMNLTGGTQNVRYALSAGYDQVLTALRGNDNKRITVRSDNAFMPLKNLEVELSVGFTSGKLHNNALGEIGSNGYNYNNQFPVRSLYPYAQFADAAGQPLTIARDYRLSYLQSLNVPGLQNWEYRPLQEIGLRDDVTNTMDLLLNAGVNYRLLKSLSVQVLYQYEKGTTDNSNYNSRETYYTRNLINLYSRLNGSQLVYRIPRGGILQENRAELTAQSFRTQVNFSKTFNSVHQVVALAGAETREKILESSGNTVYGFNKETLGAAVVNLDTLYSLFNGLGNGVGKIPSTLGFSKISDRFVSFFMNASYIYDNRYSVSASARRDASNLFGVETNNRWKPLWSAGVSWELSNEKFYHSQLFPFVKLRATYGFRGNVNNALSRYTTITRFSAILNLVNEPFAVINSPTDPSLRWESVSELNLGLDFRMKGSRIGGSVEWYRKISDDLIANALLDPATGLDGVRKNSASLITKGVQVDLNSVNLDGAFKWTSNLAFNYTKTDAKDYQIDERGRTIQGLIGDGRGILLVRGRDPYGIYSVPSAGLDPENGDPRGYLDGKISKDYFAILQQGLDTADLVYHGSGLPKFYGFLNNTFSFKGFSLGVNILYQFDFYFRRNALSYNSIFNNGNTHPDFSRRWKQSGDEAFTTVPSMIYPITNGFRDVFYNATGTNVLKGDNIRLQYIRLNYDIGTPVFGMKFIQNVQLSLIASELGFIWRANKEKLDPGFAGGFGYPVPKSYAVGLKLSF